MLVQEFLDGMAQLTPAQRSGLVICSSKVGTGSHSDWLAQWNAARDKICELEDDCPIEAELETRVNQLSAMLATTPATTIQDAAAQIVWFKEDLGGYVWGNASPEHD